MIKRRRFPRIFPGWWVVLASGFLELWGRGYQTYGFSALFKPIASELGFTRAATSTPASISRFEGGVAAPLVGWLADRYGPRGIILLGVFLMGLGLVLMNFINSLWAFLVVWGVIVGTGANTALAMPLDTAITNWFVKKRGVALSIKLAFSGLGGVVVLPIVAWLITTQGWRIACVIGGVVMWLVGLPLVWFFVKRHRPEYYGLLPDGATVREETREIRQMIDRGVKYAAEAEEIEFTLRQTMRTPVYWLLIVANGTYMLVISSINIHLIPFLTDIGINPVRAAGMMAIMASAAILARLTSGFFVDRVRRCHIRFIMAGNYGLQAISYAILLLNPESIFVIYVWLIIFGFGGAAGFVCNMMIGRYFGRKAFGSIRGVQVMFMMVPAILAPIYAGWVYDTTGSYMTVFTLFMPLLTFVTILAFLALPPKPPAKVTDIRKIV